MTEKYNTAAIFIYNTTDIKERVTAFRCKDLPYFLLNVERIKQDYTKILLDSKMFDKVKIYTTFYSSCGSKHKQCITLYKGIDNVVNYSVEDLDS